MSSFPIITPIVAVVTAVLCIVLLRRLAEIEKFKPYFSKRIYEFVVAGIVIYTLCVWVIGAFAVWSVTSHVQAPFWPF